MTSKLPESQARMDAMADAETLLSAWRQSEPLQRLGVLGNRARAGMTYSSPDARVRHAINAARAAFRVCPALKCALLLMALTFAVPAHAGRVESVSLWCGAKAADLISTERALGRGGYESNPLMRDRGVRIAAGVGSCVVAAEVDHRLRKHRKSRLALRVVGVGLMVFAVQKNERTAR